VEVAMSWLCQDSLPCCRQQVRNKLATSWHLSRLRGSCGKRV